MGGRITLTQLAREAKGLSDAERRNLDAMSEAAIETGAASDPDAVPLTDDALKAGVAERAARLAGMDVARRARAAAGLGQAEFAKRYRINLARLRDWEQGRHRPDSVAMAYLRLIVDDPQGVARVLAEDAA